MRQSLTIYGLLAWMAWGAAACGAEEAAARGPLKRVLILYSQRRELPISDQWERGIRESILANSSQRIVIDSEYLDFHRLDGMEDRRELLDLVRNKYASLLPDVVIVVNDAAARVFVADNPFPTVPVVFCSILEETRRSLPADLQCTGVLYRFEPLRTLEWAKEALSQTRRVVVVSGTAETDLALLQLIQRELDAKRPLEAEYWTGIPLEPLCRQAATLPSETVILFNSYLRDREGHVPLAPWQALQQLAESSSVPVLALYDTLLGTGVLGGCVAPVEEQGRAAGQLAARVLKGESPTDMPFVGEDMARFVFDWRAMRRWGLGSDDLPAEATVLYREPTLWEAYWPYLSVAAAVLAAQTLLIVGLAMGRRKRLRMAEELVASRNEARELATRFFAALEEERKQFARDMHDDVSQRLALHAMEAGRVASALPVESPTRTTASELKQGLSKLAEDVHRLSRRLHPTALMELGLADALRGECERISSGKGLDATFSVGPLPPDLPPEYAMCLYRIAQEALRNVAKHSGASAAHVALTADVESVYIEISDQGAGFDPSAKASQAGLGLLSMQERVHLLGGELTILSAPGQGTTVVARIPLPETVHAAAANSPR